MRIPASLRAGLCAGLLIIALALPAGSLRAEGALEPVLLTDATMTAYLDTLPEIANFTKGPKPETLKSANPAYAARLEAIARKRGFDSYEEFYWKEMAAIAARHGFADYGEFIRLSATVAVLLTGMDAETRTFTEPRQVLEDQIAFMTTFVEDMKNVLKARKPDGDPAEVLATVAPYQQALDNLIEGRSSLPEKTDPRNVAMIEKYFNQIIWVGNGRDAKD